MDFLKDAAGSAVDLCGEWRMAFSDGSDVPPARRAADLEAAGITTHPAQVPGNLELDLERAGIVEDPFFGMNATECRKYEHAHVWYWRRFDARDVEGHDSLLVFEGVDCFAEYFLNGEKIGDSENMLVEHVFDVGGKLAGENELFIHIRPALEEAKKYEYPPTAATLVHCVPSLYVRKAPHMYGWDIMPRFLSAGLWRPARLRFRPRERLERVLLRTVSADVGSARLRLDYRGRLELRHGDAYEVHMNGSCGDSSFELRTPLCFEVGHWETTVQAPRLWWPRGRGEQNLYDVTVALLKNGDEVDRLSFTHGIRTIELEMTETTTPEGDGQFLFKVNGEPVFVKGSNWVPLDAFHSRDDERLDQAIALALECGCNMLRCWGGNVYESDRFFDLCDRHGLLVWQDFAMACARYPQDEQFQGALREEARAVIRRLRQHPSLAMWCGDNECDSSYGWHQPGEDPNENLLTRVVLPRVVREEDPGRPFLPSSPYISRASYRSHGYSESQLPEQHMWGPRDYYKSPFYLNSRCHFVSEIGYHGCPAPASIEKFISKDKLWPCLDNDEWLLHATSPMPETEYYFGYRVHLMVNQIREVFGMEAGNLDEFAFASQAVQAEAKKFFIEMFRSAKWRRTGILWWNLIDGWPQMSDAVVDYYGDRKLAYYYIRTSQQPVCLMMREPGNWGQELVASNDTRDAVELTYRLSDLDTDETLAEGAARSEPDAVTTLARIPFVTGQRRFYIMDWKTAAGAAGRNHYLAGLPPFDLACYKGWAAKAGLLKPLSWVE